MSAPDATVSSRPLRARFVTLDDTVVPVAGVVVYEAKDPGKAVDDAIKSGEPAPYGAVLWDSATDLAKALYALDLHGHRVLELGCGCGLVGVVAALKGARVLCTDVDVHTLTATARAASDAAVDVVTDLFDFMGAAPLPLVDGAVATDVILADVLYEPMLAAAAARRTLEALAIGARVLVGDPDRAGRRDFVRLLKDAGHDVVFGTGLNDARANDGASGTICVIAPRPRG